MHLVYFKISLRLRFSAAERIPAMSEIPPIVLGTTPNSLVTLSRDSPQIRQVALPAATSVLQ